jgi:hypothetical protein
MAEVGILGRRDRVELIKGEIVEMSPIGPRHNAFADNLNRLLPRRRAGHDRYLRLSASGQGAQARGHGLRASQAVAVPFTPPSPGP